MQHPKLQLFRDPLGEFRFQLVARDGQTVLSSNESYTSKLFCLSAMEFIKAHTPFDNFYARKITTDRKYYFTLRESSGQTLAESNIFSDYFSRETSIALVKSIAPFAIIEDLTEVFSIGVPETPAYGQLVSLTGELS